MEEINDISINMKKWRKTIKDNEEKLMENVNDMGINKTI